jgi:LPS-assembly protein
MTFADENPAPVTTPEVVPGQAHITADTLSGEMNSELRARGNVVVTRDDQTLTSDWLNYYQAKNNVKAGDHFVLTRQHDQVTGSTLDYNLDSRTGIGMQPMFNSGEPGKKMRGSGDKVEFRGRDNYRVFKSSATTCMVGDDSWYLKSSQLDLNYTTGIGTAHNADIVFKGVPILYTPWMDFSLNGQRKSGFLYPMLSGGSNGMELALPYYWNIAPNYDATLTPHLNLRHGLMLGAEFRYLEPGYSGWLYTEQLPHDEVTDHYRDLWSAQHKQTLAPGLTLGYDVNRVSDDNYFTDFGNRTSVAANVNLLNQAWVNYAFSWEGGSATANLLEQRYQTLQSTGTTVTPPYAREPDLSLSANQSLPGGFTGSVLTDLTQFSHPFLQEGDRLVLYPSISWPFERSWGFFKPKIGVNYTQYQLDAYSGRSNEDITRSLPIFTTDTGLYFDRQVRWFGSEQGQTQTLEPRLFYVRIPTVDQSQIPNFDTSQNDYGFAQLFSENSYSGWDKINGANQLTGALTTRLIDNDSGREMIRAAIGQRMYFGQSNINLNGTVYNQDATTSDFLASLGGEVVKNWNLDSLYEYNAQIHGPEQYNVDLNYSPEQGKVASLRYRFNSNGALSPTGATENLHSVDIGLQWPVAPKWYALIRGNYSLQDKQLLDQLMGVEYNAGCWTVRLIGERYITNLIQTKSAVYLQLELNGLGSIGSNPKDTLRLAIPGYTQTNDIHP